ncbi:hypothetical protein [Anaerocolumna aminovalerica]|uniref:hypothetical protein n=1 Tax=Anaerocolumna aminovalerica TaxID=1527 RepID=UPI001C0F2531|nr:hypothetical protein [Anaerocolumna aminovalerica]MBU5333666.1 hypothetical protein [Anaerocolumna aminovalerica]
MKNKVRISVIIIIIIIVSIIYIVFNLPKKFDINIQVINQTQKNINTDINISFGMENTSDIRKIFSLSNINKNSKKSEKIIVDNIQGDYGIILKVEENSSNSFYYTSYSKLSKVNINLEIVETSDGNIIVQGIVTSKHFLGTKKTVQIKPVTLKGDT